MKTSQSFHASVNIPPNEYGHIITDRIVRTRARHTLEIIPENDQIEARTREYRFSMLRTLHEFATSFSDTENAPDATHLVQSFIKLATTLADSKALAFPLKIETAAEDSHAEVRSLEVEWDSHPFSFSNDKSANTQTTVPHHLLESVTHPLSIALLAYHFGGPVNAAHSARKHTWRCGPSSGASTPDFHVEGGVDGVFKDVRVTVVWEEQGPTLVGPTGKHDVFLTGDATPLPLAISKSIHDQDLHLPLNIIYNHGDATLYYDCQDPTVVRNSVSLDFHLNAVTTDTFQLLSVVPDQQDIDKLTLTALVTRFPVANYTARFQSLLYGKDAVAAILRKLASLHMPVVAPPVYDQSDHAITSRFQDYNNNNVQHIPFVISSRPSDIPLAGVYRSPVSFLDSICAKALRDIHRPIGHNLFPQNIIDQKREDARKFIRDLPEELISSQLANYANMLILIPYTSSDLLTTLSLHNLAANMERRCLELVAFGFVDPIVDMSSIAALASAFGAALNGLKEIHVNHEPWIEEADLMMFRTRCLYLFWCVDWFVCYLVNPMEGPFMMLDAQKLSGHLSTVRQEMAQTAHLLLRNWVAWGMFMEGLPQGGFFVRQSAGFGK
ncbi:hypothetical protein T440DRAFT_451244 [Plenodomus tracheiphilus IPT5]|uniref:Uncharacterized protein n=1 Tax=Plenodomus tracheiphilus IPT5 TaxID=1408161 RepID=A0A6A7B3W4_9PLEO|nr:hypothetical protein T440DRAFT_451244 [Plenodomus tracheiphilus IPT5]